MRFPIAGFRKFLKKFHIFLLEIAILQEKLIQDIVHFYGRFEGVDSFCWVGVHDGDEFMIFAGLRQWLEAKLV